MKNKLENLLAMVQRRDARIRELERDLGTARNAAQEMEIVAHSAIQRAEEGITELRFVVPGYGKRPDLHGTVRKVFDRWELVEGCALDKRIDELERYEGADWLGKVE